MSSSRKVKGSNMKAGADLVMADSLDDLSDFHDFRRDILPIMQKALKQKWSQEKILAEVDAFLTAKLVSLALMGNTQPQAALAAIQQAKDRLHGKPTQVIDQTTVLSKMSDDNLETKIKNLQEKLEPKDTIQ